MIDWGYAFLLFFVLYTFWTTAKIYVKVDAIGSMLATLMIHTAKTKEWSEVTPEELATPNEDWEAWENWDETDA